MLSAIKSLEPERITMNIDLRRRTDEVVSRLTQLRDNF